MSKFLRITGWIALVLAAIIGLLRLTAIRWWQLPTNDPYFEASVEPTLHGGDWVVLWRATKPNYGALVLCPEPKSNRPVIGRIVGEAGDHIKLTGSMLTVNKTLMQTEGKCDQFHVRDPANGSDVVQNCSFEVLNDRTHPRGNQADSTKPAYGDPPPDPEFDVPGGQVFLLSDNRALPYDSRDYGFVDRNQCVETVVLRLVSKDGFFDVGNRLSLIR